MTPEEARLMMSLYRPYMVQAIIELDPEGEAFGLGIARPTSEEEVGPFVSMMLEMPNSDRKERYVNAIMKKLEEVAKRKQKPEIKVTLANLEYGYVLNNDIDPKDVDITITDENGTSKFTLEYLLENMING
jgi:hypothetical protein